MHEIVIQFNKEGGSLQFTMEEPTNCQISFLDILLDFECGFIETDWFKKPIASGQVINFHLNHSMNHKRGIVFSLVDRAINLAETKFHRKNINQIFEILTGNNYPYEFIKQNIDERIKTINSNNNKNIINSELEKNFDTSKIITLPFITEISQSILTLTKKLKIPVIFCIQNKFNEIFLPSPKDKVPKFEKTILIYKINCIDCKKVYIGQTKQFLKNRIHQHKYSQIHSKTNTALCEHTTTLNHKFDFN